MPGKELKVGPGGDYVLLLGSEISTSVGDEAGSNGGVGGAKGTKGTCKITQASKNVVYGPQKKGLVRFMDSTDQNGGNAQGAVLSALPTILVGDE